MFSSTTTQRSLKHRTSAMALSVLLNISGLGALLMVGDVQHIIEAVDEAPLIEVVLAESRAPGAAIAALSAATTQPVPAVVPPGQPSEPTAQPEPEPTAQPAAAAEVIIAALGPVDGSPAPGGCPPGQHCDGPAPADGTACPPGQVCGTEASSLLHISSAEAYPKRRVRPIFPAAAKQLNIQEARCMVRFAINTRGHPTDVAISGCPSVFHASVEQAAWKWRFYPVRTDQGVRTEAVFTLALTFVLR